MSERISLTLGDGLEPISTHALAGLPIKPGPQIAPIRHHTIQEMVVASLDQFGYRMKDSFHAVAKEGARYVGLFDILVNETRDYRWGIMATNANDGSKTMWLHSGIILHGADNTFSVHCSDEVFKSHRFFTSDELQVLVNESVTRLNDHFNLMEHRMEHLKGKKLTSAEGHHLICNIIASEVVAGRVAAELIDRWNNPDFEYLHPRTMWSAFCLCSWFLKRLRPAALVERTINLHHFFDDVAKFNKKTTRYKQTAFA